MTGAQEQNVTGDDPAIGSRLLCGEQILILHKVGIMDRKELEKRYVRTRRELILREFQGLNDMQQKAVMATEGPLLLLAGAGSGKTTVLINRVANLIRFGRASDTDEVPEEAGEAELALLESAVREAGELTPEAETLCALDPVEPWRIIAITFTNKAADELKSRLEARLGPGAQDVWAMTFHSACVRILRKSGEAMGLPSSFTIYDASDSAAVMKRILRELNMDEKVFPPKSVLSAISRAKDEMLSAQDYAAEAEKGYDPRKKQIAKAYIEYSRRLLAADALDFDDLILFTVRLLRDYPEVRERWQRQFKYVLVDEYQDTSKIQYKLAAYLAGGRENICVVGDDDQSIYRFRGATIENILGFEKQYKNARVIKLEQNYRSTGHILGAANSVIKNNVGRKGKNLWTSAGDGEKLTLRVTENDDEEAAFVAGKIVDGVSSGMRWGDFAVLYRMNAQSNRLEYAFKRMGIPYRVIGGTRFFDRMEIKDITSYLCAVQNPADDLRLLRVINNPPRGIGDTTLERLRAISAAERRPLLDVAADAAAYPELRSAVGKLMKFLELMMELRGLSETMPLPEFYDALLDKTGYLAALGDSDEALSRRDNIMELKSNIVNYAAGTESPSLAGFLDEIALYTDLDSMESGEDSVVMMTIHSAKGLEFPWVFLVGMEDGIFPSSRTIGDEEEMEEERRLCYVALTRAKRYLTLTAARRRMLFGRTTSNLISRFVEEIPDEHIVKPAGAPRQGLRYEPDPEYMEYSYREQSFGRREGWGGYREHVSPVDAQRPGPARAPSGAVRRPSPKPPVSRATAPARPSAALTELHAGDRIRHKVFGEGTVTDVKTMPGDALITVDFGGTVKRLMLKATSFVITKL